MLLVEDRKMMGEVFYGDIFGAFIMIIIVSNTPRTYPKPSPSPKPGQSPNPNNYP